LHKLKGVLYFEFYKSAAWAKALIYEKHNLLFIESGGYYHLADCLNDHSFSTPAEAFGPF
jgi:hypothetical protein